MQIFNQFTQDGNKTLVQSVMLDKENAAIIISESDGLRLNSLVIDIAGAEALCEAIQKELKEGDLS
jgi:hypothetical protein